MGCFMGGVVVLSRWSQHLSGARYFFVGLILPQLGGNGGMGEREWCDRVLSKVTLGNHSLNEEYGNSR